MSFELKNITTTEIDKVANIGTLARVMRSNYASGVDQAIIPERISILRENPFSAFETMPAYSEKLGLFMSKIGCVVPQKSPDARSVHAVVIAFCTQSGRPIALFDGNALTELKCAAISAMVTDLCAAVDAKVHAVIGSGIQAAVQVSAVTAVRPIEEIRVFSRNASRLNDFVRSIRQRNPAVRVMSCGSAEQAVDDADIISTATTSITPVIPIDGLTKRPLHVNCVGNHTTESRELPVDVLLNDSFVVVEDMPTALREAGPSHRYGVTIEQVVRRAAIPRPSQRTIFASTGHAYLDLITVAYLLDTLKISRIHS
jgi:ornithine cyclodeaminase/alanine dehydrogenase-like protein (mu-crystallin family)